MDEFNKSLAAQRLIAIDNLESEIDSKKVQNLSKIQELESLIKNKEANLKVAEIEEIIKSLAIQTKCGCGIIPKIR